MLKNKIIHAFKLSDVVFIMLMNVKMATINGSLAFMSRINFVLNLVKLYNPRACPQGLGQGKGHFSLLIYTD